MRQPRLIHPVDVKVIPKGTNKGVSQHSGDDVVVGRKKGTDLTVKLSGQPRWYTKDKLRRDEPTPTEGSTGYILFRVIDLEKNGYTFKHGDNFVEIGGVVQNLFVLGTRPMGHYKGKARLLAVDFKDRQPVET